MDANPRPDHENEMGDREPEPDYFAVEPRTDCPHATEEALDAFSLFLLSRLKDYQKNSQTNVFSVLPCKDCQSTQENWICLTCSDVFCSRYVHGHMAAHGASTGHPVAFSFSDGSFWCYTCDSYVTNLELGKLRKTFGAIKHKMEVGMCDLQEGDRIFPILTELNRLNDASGTFSRTELVKGLKEGKFKKIVGVTGAGISVAAGIPDFRSPGGLYHKLAEKYGLTKPEEIMTLDFFRKHPEPLYEIMKEFLGATIKPTACHKFFVELAKRGQLLKYYTQNIDGLEVEAGMPQDLLLQAHGHIRSCSCSVCLSRILVN